jgi:hypothetical protein
MLKKQGEKMERKIAGRNTNNFSSSGKSTERCIKENASGSTNKLLGIEVSEDKRFLLNDGRSLRTIRELQDVLGDMDNSVFQHHVNPERNDFSNWIKDVFNEAPLAAKIAKMENRFNMKDTIEKYISGEKGNKGCSCC